MSIPREGSRDTGSGIIISVTPDVCRTPVGSSMPPIPYSIYAIQGDDANTAATVRMTGQRAHNMASIVTQCSGDAPGTGGGVSSGTTGSVCHPRSHSNSVRIQGEWAVRHNDYWDMNNRNTIGRLIWVESTETFEPTPPILLADANPATLAQFIEPGPDVTGLELPPSEPVGGEVATTPPAPGGQEPPGGGESTGARFWYFLRNFGKGGISPSGPGAMNAMGWLDNWLDDNIGRPNEWFLDGPSRRTEYWYDPDREFPPIPDDGPMLPVVEDDRITYSADASKIEDNAPETGATEDQVRVTGDEEERERECIVGQYGRLAGRCPGGDDQRHHIVPDFVFRYGTAKQSDQRIDDMPSRYGGMAICLDGMATIEGTEHNIAQTAADDEIERVAQLPSNPLPGTVPLGVAVDAGVAGAIEARPDCREEIIRAMERQHRGHDFTRRVSGVQGRNVEPARSVLAGEAEFP